MLSLVLIIINTSGPTYSVRWLSIEAYLIQWYKLCYTWIWCCFHMAIRSTALPMLFRVANFLIINWSNSFLSRKKINRSCHSNFIRNLNSIWSSLRGITTWKLTLNEFSAIRGVDATRVPTTSTKLKRSEKWRWILSIMRIYAKYAIWIKWSIWVWKLIYLTSMLWWQEPGLKLDISFVWDCLEMAQECSQWLDTHILLWPIIKGNQTTLTNLIKSLKGEISSIRDKGKPIFDIVVNNACHTVAPPKEFY
jgi:hypothetical protein